MTELRVFSVNACQVNVVYVDFQEAFDVVYHVPYIVHRTVQLWQLQTLNQGQVSLSY